MRVSALGCLSGEAVSLTVDCALPSFILGYHGCDRSTAEAVFAGEAQLKLSQNDYDWLGEGIYFWEHNAQRAYDFAVQMKARPHPSGQKIKTPAVVGAVIDLGYCLNLLDSRFIRLVAEAHNVLEKLSSAAEIEMPQNTGGSDLVDRKLDCAVIRMLHHLRKHDEQPAFDSVRAAFLEGKPLYENAGFAERSHIQVCVRDHRFIKGCFRPLDENGKPLTFKASRK